MTLNLSITPVSNLKYGNGFLKLLAIIDSYIIMAVGLFYIGRKIVHTIKFLLVNRVSPEAFEEVPLDGICDLYAQPGAETDWTAIGAVPFFWGEQDYTWESVISYMALGYMADTCDIGGEDLTAIFMCRFAGLPGPVAILTVTGNENDNYVSWTTGINAIASNDRSWRDAIRRGLKHRMGDY